MLKEISEKHAGHDRKTTKTVLKGIEKFLLSEQEVRGWHMVTYLKHMRRWTHSLVRNRNSTLARKKDLSQQESIQKASQEVQEPLETQPIASEDLSNLLTNQRWLKLAQACANLFD